MRLFISRERDWGSKRGLPVFLKGEIEDVFILRKRLGFEGGRTCSFEGEIEVVVHI